MICWCFFLYVTSLNYLIRNLSIAENEEGEEEEEVGEETANIFSALNNTVSILPDAGMFTH